VGPLAWTLLLAPLTAAAADDARPLYELQDVVPVPNASTERIYDSARTWMLETLREQPDKTGDAARSWTSERLRDPSGDLAEDRLAGTLVAVAKEKFVTVDAKSSCSLWLRYRVIVGARPGRYYYSVSVLELEPDPMCLRPGFEITTLDWLGVKPPPAGIELHLSGSEETPAALASDAEIRTRAKALAEKLSVSLRARLARVGSRSGSK
jgi:hypothetical protein